MLPKNRIVWKLNAAITALFSVIIILAAWAEHSFGYRPACRSVREVVGTATASLARELGAMPQHSDAGRVISHLESIRDLEQLYEELHLLSHPSGLTTASTREAAVGAADPESPSCVLCHVADVEELDAVAAGSVELEDRYLELPGAGGQIALLTPLRNEPSCAAAGCHADRQQGETLGLLRSDHAASTLDPTSAFRGIYTVLLVLLVILVTSTALRLLFLRMLQRPISGLIAGTRRIAERDLDFRFPADRRDELGVLERSFNNMTARIRAHQEALRNSTEYLNGIIENSADIIITVTPWHLIQTFNRGAEQLLGYARSEVQGQRIEILFANPEDRKLDLDRLDHDDNVRNLRTDFVTKGGEIKNVLLTLTRLRDAEGNPIGTLGISKDITEELRLTKQLIRNKRFAAIGEAVTGIQHAIKNMLNALKGGSYLVQRGIKNSDRQKLDDGCGLMEEGISRMTALSKSMLNYARNWTFEFKSVDLRSMLGGIQEMLSPSAAEKGIAVRAELDEDLPDVSCDSEMIHMAIMDLASNAVDACAEKGAEKGYCEGEQAEILLRAFLSPDGKLYHVEVSDNGPGMTEDVRENIFKPFYSTKRKSGTGLGLALTQRAIEAHGGVIEVESELGRGATFRIGLPSQDARDHQETTDGQEGTGS